MRTGHMSAPRGKIVVVHLRNGEKIIARFMKRDGRFVYLQGHDPVRCERIRTVSIRVNSTGE